MAKDTSTRIDLGFRRIKLIPISNYQSPSSNLFDKYKTKNWIKSGILLRAFFPWIDCYVAWHEGYDHSKDI
jgi:hypothetical protein